nr:T9SS type A sorting domain-containing protein [Candidatus Cloacimonadota bacterium]
AFPSNSSNPFWFYGIESDPDPISNLSIYSDDNYNWKALKCSPRANSYGYYAVKNLKVRQTMVATWINGNEIRYLTGMMLTHELIDTLYIKHKVTLLDSLTTNDGAVYIAGLKIAVKSRSDIPFDYNISSLLHSTYPNIYNENTITKAHLLNQTLPHKDGFVTIEYKLSVSELMSYLRSQGDSLETYWGGKILYISPTLYYMNNGDLLIDNVTMEDNLFRSLKNPDSHWLDSINTRISDLREENDNIVYLESRDEPLPPQFQAFKLINEKAIANNLHMITAVNGYGRDNYSDIKYDLMNHFKIETESRVVAPDWYLYGNQKKKYNSSTINSEHIQQLITNMCDYYESVRNDTLRFLPVVQTYGEWSVSGYWNGIMLPPDAQQRMLMYLPMCYGADGIQTFRMMANTNLDSINVNPGNPSDEGDTSTEYRGDADPKIAAINKRGGALEALSQYEVIKEALFNIKKIGHMTKDLEWEHAGTIMTVNELISTGSNNFSVSGQVINQNDNSAITPSYSGYVQYGSYTDIDNQVYLMLVNRRTNKRTIGVEGDIVATFNVNNAFSTASPQTLRLTIDGLSPNQVVTNTLTGDIYNLSNGVCDIQIEAGEGLFIKIGDRQVPAVVKANDTLELSNQKIYHDIINKGYLTISDSVEFINARIINDIDGQLDILNANVKSNLLNNLFIDNYGNVSISNSSIYSKGTVIACKANSTTNINNVNISADMGCIQYGSNSNIIINDSELTSKDKLLSLIPREGGVESDISINNTIFNGYQNNNIGIEYYSYDGNHLIIENSTFKGFDTALSYYTPSSNNDHISNCIFQKNNTGIRLLGEGNMLPITVCEFTDNLIGIDNIFTNTKIDGCLFKRYNLGLDLVNGTPIGIRMENNFTFPISRSENLPDMIWQIRNSNFMYLNTGIEVLGSSPRFINNIFNSMNNLKLLDNAYPDISWNAHNVLGHLSQTTNHVTLSKTSSLKLKSGHNDFYNPSQNDFNVYNRTTIPQIINCSKNYFQANNDSLFVVISNSNFTSSFFINNLDSSPNQNTPFVIENEFDQARDLLKQGDYIPALLIFKNVLINQIENERDYWKESADECFNITGYIKGDFEELRLVYEGLYENPPVFLNIDEMKDYVYLMKDYEKRCYMMIESKSDTNLQMAKNILSDRIQNDDDEVSVICAKINLDNISLLEEYQNTENKAATDYVNNQVKINAILVSKADKFKQLNRLLNPEDHSSVPIPKKLFSQNYPNPFNPTTTIQYGLAKDTHVKINIYNIKGQKVKTLINENKQAGVHKIVWDGKDHKQKNVSSGIYFYHIQTNHGRVTRKMLMMK